MNDFSEKKRILHNFKIYALRLNQFSNNDKYDLAKYLSEFHTLIQSKKDREFISVVFETAEDRYSNWKIGPNPSTFTVKDMIEMTRHYYWYNNQA